MLTYLYSLFLKLLFVMYQKLQNVPYIFQFSLQMYKAQLHITFFFLNRWEDGVVFTLNNMFKITMLVSSPAGIQTHSFLLAPKPLLFTHAWTPTHNAHPRACRGWRWESWVYVHIAASPWTNCFLSLTSSLHAAGGHGRPGSSQSSDQH